MSTNRKLLGVMVEKDEMICLQTGDNVWFPLNGNSGVAADFRESFNEPQRSDIGKRLYNVGGVLQMENDAQREAREAQEGASQ